MPSYPQREFFTNLEHMLKQERTAPSNFMVPVFYLHLLSLSPAHWIAPDLLRFDNKAAWQTAFLSDHTIEMVAKNLRRYKLLVQRLRWMLEFLFLQPRPSSHEELLRGEAEASASEAIILPPETVLAHLSSLSFRDHLDFKIRAAHPHFPKTRASDSSLTQLVTLFHAEAEDFFAHSLTLLTQHGWMDVMPASAGNDLLIRLNRFPTRATTQRSLAGMLLPPNNPTPSCHTMQTSCPQYHSQQTSSYEMLWLSGTQSGNITGIGVTLTGDFGSFSGVSNQQSYLAQRVAPPPTPAFRLDRYGCLLPIGATILWIAFNVLASRFLWRKLPSSLGWLLNKPLALLFLIGLLISGFGPLIWRIIKYPQEKANLLQQQEEWKRS